MIVLGTTVNCVFELLGLVAEFTVTVMEPEVVPLGTTATICDAPQVEIDVA